MKNIILTLVLLAPAASFANIYLEAGQSIGLSDGSRVYCEQRREPSYRFSCVCTVKNSTYFQHGVTVMTNNPYGPGIGAVLAACKNLPFYTYNIPDADLKDCRRD